MREIEQRDFDQIYAICERLFREADAKALILSDINGQLIYSIGPSEDLSDQVSRMPDIEENEFSIVFPDEDGRDNVFCRLVGDHLVLVLFFTLAARLDAVRASAAKAAELIDFIVRTVKWEPGRG